jgi:hypothetical protein
MTFEFVFALSQCDGGGNFFVQADTIHSDVAARNSGIGSQVPAATIGS